MPTPHPHLVFIRPCCTCPILQARDGAQAARDNLDGRELGGHELHVGWGKAVPIPAFPIYPPPEGLAAGRMGAVAPPALPWGPGPPTPSRRVGGSGFSTGGPTPPLAPLPPSAIATVEAIKERPKDPEHIGNGPDIRVVVPEPRQRFIIDTLADYVSVDGSDFEQVLFAAPAYPEGGEETRALQTPQPPLFLSTPQSTPLTAVK